MSRGSGYGRSQMTWCRRWLPSHMICWSKCMEKTWTESHAAMLVLSTLVDGCWWILRSNIALADGSENTPTTLEVPNGKLGGTTTWAKAEYDRLAPRFACYPNPATLKIIEALLDWFTGEMLQTTPIFDGYKKPWKTRSFLGEVGRRRSPKMGKDILLFPALPGMAHLINWTVSLGESFLSFFSVQFENASSFNSKLCHINIISKF